MKTYQVVRITPSGSEFGVGKLYSNRQSAVLFRHQVRRSYSPDALEIREIDIDESDRLEPIG